MEEKKVSMIKPLNIKDKERAEEVLKKGLEEETPTGSFENDTVPMILDENNTFVKKKGNEIEGLVVFGPDKGSKTRYKIEFICSCTHRKGTGRELILHLAGHLRKLGVSEVITTVSSIDQRACSFYEKCGFTEYGTEEKDHEKGTFIVNKIKATPQQIQHALST